MAKNIELEFVSSTAAALKAAIKELYIPAYFGRAGVLENHLPYISLIKPGEIYYKDLDDKEHYFYVKDGFLEVLENKIVLVSDSIERGADLDKSEIEAKLREIEELITASKSVAAGITVEQLDKALQEQREDMTKLEIVEKSGSS